MNANAIRQATLALIVIFAVNGSYFGAWATRIPDTKARFDLSADQLGLFLLLLAIGSIVSFPTAGRLVDRIGAKRATLWTLPYYVVALILLGLAPNLWILGIALVLFGSSHGSMDVAMNAWGAEVERATKRPILGRFHAFYSLGAGAGAAIGAASIGLGMSTAAHLVSFALVTGLLLLLAGRSDWISTIPKKTTKTPMIAWPRGPLLLVGLAAFASSIGEGSMFDWGALFILDRIDVGTAKAALGLTVFSVTMVIVRLLSSQIVSTLGQARAVVISGGLALAGLLLALNTWNIWIIYFGFGIMGLGYALIFPLAFSRAGNDATLAPGQAMAQVATLGYGGMLLGPPLIGFLTERGGFNLSFGFIALLAAAILFLSRGFAPR
ncbi:MAG: MFS transporter [Pseudomonadota bacterium]